jgi:hypothetical protein
VIVCGCSAGAVSSSTTETRPSDIGAFTKSLFGTAFDDNDRVALIVLAPLDSQSLLETTTFALLNEVEGYSWVGPEQIEAAASDFAAQHGTDPLPGSWFAYGLIPQFDDSSIGDWERVLGDMAGTVTAVRAVTAVEVDLPEGWTVLADLPFGVSSGALVSFIDMGVVVIDRTATRFIGLDGSVASTDIQPLPVVEVCCGSAHIFSAGDSIVGVSEGAVSSWVLDVATFLWREVESRPSSGFVLGATTTNAALAMLTAAPRTGAGVSHVMLLDLASGSWTEIGPTPEPIAVGGITSDGDRVFAAGTHQGPNNNILGSDPNPNVWEYTSAGVWSELTEIPIHGQASTITWIEDAGLLAWNYDLESALLDQSGEWRGLGRVTMPPAECYPRSQAAGRAAFAYCGGLARLDGATLEWKAIPSPQQAAAWYGVVDGRLVGILRTERDQSLLIEYQLP